MGKYVYYGGNGECSPVGSSEPLRSFVDTTDLGRLLYWLPQFFMNDQSKEKSGE